MRTYDPWRRVDKKSTDLSIRPRRPLISMSFIKSKDVELFRVFNNMKITLELTLFRCFQLAIRGRLNWESSSFCITTLYTLSLELCICNSKSEITELVLIGSRIITRFAARAVFVSPFLLQNS